MRKSPSLTSQREILAKEWTLGPAVGTCHINSALTIAAESTKQVWSARGAYMPDMVSTLVLAQHKTLASISPIKLQVSSCDPTILSSPAP